MTEEISSGNADNCVQVITKHDGEYLTLVVELRRSCGVSNRVEHTAACRAVSEIPSTVVPALGPLAQGPSPPVGQPAAIENPSLRIHP